MDFVISRELPADTNPLDYLTPDGTAWHRRGNAIIGIGRAAQWVGTDMVAASKWWRKFVAGLDYEPEYQPVAFGTFLFDPNHTEAQATLIVPKIIVAKRDERVWTVAINCEGLAEDGSLPPELAAEFGLVVPGVAGFGWPVADGSVESSLKLSEFSPELDPKIWCDEVASAAQRIRTNGLAKVVLARAMRAKVLGVSSAVGLNQGVSCDGMDNSPTGTDNSPTGTDNSPTQIKIDPRPALRRLANDYDSCWTFHIDGFLGASPEMLLRRELGLVTSRVLAGTIRRIPGAEEQLARTLGSSSKDLIEHRLAVESVAKALQPLCSGMNVPDEPYVLHLPNVLHLASDVTGVAKSTATSLELAAALHPSAAVCGTPTSGARQFIAEHEHLDRGRYSGPVGWLNAEGDGEWCIGLRSGQIAPDGKSVRIFAGCGIVADSQPEKELAETQDKLVPMLTAFSVRD